MAAPGVPLPHIRTEPPSSAHEDKLYLVTRADLSTGYQITQTVHATADFLAAHPGAGADWAAKSNSVIVLTVPNEAGLYDLLERAGAKDITTVTFREPDLGDELTAIAFHPGQATRKLLSNLPLAGRRLPDQEPLLAREKQLRELSFTMMDCDQTPGQDVLAHGRSVREHYFVLLDHLTGKVNLHNAPNWHLPTWVDEYADQLAAATLPRHTMATYLALHDCGKPTVKEVDADGRSHFPGHAQASAATYAALPGADPLVTDLIAGDMDIHTLSAADIPEFATRATAIAHLLAGLAEVHSNAGMFGGVSSTSFKIKRKHLDKRGRALCRHLFGDPTPTTPTGAPAAPTQEKTR